ncbi:hypothetical protein ACFLYE_01495 [Chloroflexota bacterium]
MMKRKVETVPQEPLTRTECHHHWIIESPKGQISKGVCKFCGTEKEFYNSWPYLIVDERAVKPAEFTGLKNSEPDKGIRGKGKQWRHAATNDRNQTPAEGN